MAVRTLEMLSVLGQRSLPSRVVRLLLLKVVGSRPARRANPEADSPCSRANRSMARQISEWRSMGTLSYKVGIFALGTYAFLFPTPA